MIFFNCERYSNWPSLRSKTLRLVWVCQVFVMIIEVVLSPLLKVPLNCNYSG